MRWHQLYVIQLQGSNDSSGRRLGWAGLGGPKPVGQSPSLSHTRPTNKQEEAEPFYYCCRCLLAIISVPLTKLNVICFRLPISLATRLIIIEMRMMMMISHPPHLPTTYPLMPIAQEIQALPPLLPLVCVWQRMTIYGQSVRIASPIEHQLLFMRIHLVRD